MFGILLDGLRDLMTSASGSLIRSSNCRLHQVAVLSEIKNRETLLCSIPGMYGGFSLQLVVEENDGAIKIVAESWCRVVVG